MDEKNPRLSGGVPLLEVRSSTGENFNVDCLWGQRNTVQIGMDGIEFGKVLIQTEVCLRSVSFNGDCRG